MKKIGFLIGLILLTTFLVLWIKSNPSRITEPPPAFQVGDVVGELNGVKIFYNGKVGNTGGRNSTVDGYNLGLRYQCVEFVKRYYFERLGHRMPNTWGHAKDFFDSNIPDGKLSPLRALTQYRNGGSSKPKVDDLLVFGPTKWNQYGHVAIVSSVSSESIEIAQQNPGPRGKPRVTIGLVSESGGWKIDHDYVLGWLRKP